MTPMFSWSLYQLAVAKYKNETRSSSVYNQHSPTVPQLDFRKFLEDNDDIRDEDLVAWVTIGGFHVPHSEDVPNTATAGNTARFFIRPFNYFEEDPSMGSTNAVLMKVGPTGLEVERYGTPDKSSCIPNEDWLAPWLGPFFSCSFCWYITYFMGGRSTKWAALNLRP